MMTPLGASDVGILMLGFFDASLNSVLQISEDAGK